MEAYSNLGRSERINSLEETLKQNLEDRSTDQIKNCQLPGEKKSAYAKALDSALGAVKTAEGHKLGARRAAARRKRPGRRCSPHCSSALSTRF